MRKNDPVIGEVRRGKEIKGGVFMKIKIADIKKKMFEWRDFYGADIFESDRIKKAKTKKELDKILSDYRHHMEDREQDALGHFDQFRNSLGI
jgi:hypothetical protein